MNDAILVGHLGLGDQIICNSIIRHLSKKHETLFLPTKKHNVMNVRAMLKDVKNVNLIPVEDDTEMLLYVSRISRMVDKVYRLGIFGEDFMTSAKTFDQSFYIQAKLDYSSRWDQFSYFEDHEKQERLLSKVKKDYIFVHHDPVRNLNIKQKYLNEKEIFTPQHSLGDTSEFSLFDYKRVLIHAKEIHCIDSSFACMIDHMPELKSKPKFLHRYVRSGNLNPLYKNDWNILHD